MAEHHPDFATCGLPVVDGVEQRIREIRREEKNADTPCLVMTKK
jgi:hypothetical protein